MQDSRKPKLERSGKSKSLDSCELVFSQTKLSTKEPEKISRKLHEIAEGRTSSVDTSEPTKCLKCHRSVNPNEQCKHCQSAQFAVDEQQKKEEKIRIVSTTQKKDFTANTHVYESLYKSQEQQKILQRKTGGTPRKKKLDVITSFTDSPLFTRKHRFGIRNRSKETGSSSETNTESTTPLLGRKNDNGFSFVKQLTEVRWRRREAQNNVNTVKNQHDYLGHIQGTSTNGNAVEATPVEAKASVSLQAQVLQLYLFDTSIQTFIRTYIHKGTRALFL